MSEGLDNELIGLIAGTGSLPFAVAEGVKALGGRLAVFGLEGLADETIEDEVDEYHSIEIGKLGKLIKTIKKSGVKKIVMAGKVPKSLLYTMNVVPDLHAVKLLYSLKNRSDDTIMAAILGEIEKEGVTVVKTTDFTRPLMAPAKCLTRRVPTEDEMADISFGANIAREIGRLDIGQTVVVKKKAVMAIEAIEGTDEAVKRGGLLAGGGAVVVKTAKPAQDERFDVPVVGVETLKSMQACNASVLAVEAGRVIIVDRKKLIHMADSMKISVVGFE
ncbi:MAG: UDP-2,3-diacylglucosamine diphosphatase LpxI [Nitrospirae bacterium]|nr:UDP-2,3-diacylglucosamine diphosphatase LpxI [Nitrospirota bacterium]